MGAMTVDSRDEAFEGAEVEVMLTRVVDPFDGASTDERADLEQALEAARPDFDNADHIDAREFVTGLLAKL
jgi:hypothetical protein